MIGSTPFDKIEKGGEHREGAEELADRDGTLGAMARIALALADGEQPDPDDTETAGLEAIHDLGGDGRR